MRLALTFWELVEKRHERKLCLGFGLGLFQRHGLAYSL